MNNTTVACLRNVAVKMVLGGLLFFAAARGANAGPAPLPLEARLDTAKSVFVGQVTQIEKTVPVENQIQMGRATIAVKEVLKGTPGEVVKLLVPIAWPEHYQGSYSGRPFHVGDLGIWLVGVRDMAGTWGFYDQEVRADVQRILQSLPQQKWSEPVHGLRARVIAVGPQSGWKPRGAFLFAVTNVSAADIFVPEAVTGDQDTARGPGVLTATATDDKGRGVDLWLDRRRDLPPARCEKLRPGETTYLGRVLLLEECYSGRNRKKLAPGRYQLVVSCKNECDHGMAAEDPPQKGIRKVTPWKGELAAPPIGLLLPE